MNISECRWVTTTKISVFVSVGVLFSTCESPKMGTLQPWPEVLGFFMGSRKPSEEWVPGYLRTDISAFMDGMGTSVLQKSDDWGGGRWYGKHISPIFAGHAMMGKNRPREFWRTRTAWSTSFFIRCSCNDLFFSANNPLISSLTLFIHLSSAASNFIVIKLYYNFHI